MSDVTVYKDGKVLKRYTAADKSNEVHACQPLDGGGVYHIDACGRGDESGCGNEPAD